VKLKLTILAALLPLLLAGCGIKDLAKQAADATACKAIEPSIKAITSTYQSGIVDSGVIKQVDNLIGDQARAVLSTGLAKDLKSLTTTLKNGSASTKSQEEIKKLTQSISKRCSEASVNPLGG
jgi:hypothetical protein